MLHPCRSALSYETGAAIRVKPQQYLGKYKLLECLGKGGMAEVWKAFDPGLQRFVAIKIPLPELQANPEFLTRFKQEGRISANLRHPNIVNIHNFEITFDPESSNSLAYIVMEYIEGETLASYLNSPSHRGKFLSRTDIAHLFTAICLAIDYAHQEGLLHRDIKPANILLDKRNTSYNPDAMGEPILTDFGLAKLLGAPAGELTRHTIGTPLYMSPEQAQGFSGDERSDIYSLGVILYEICTAKPPFQGGFVSLIAQKVNTTPPSPHLINPNIQPALASVILHGLAKDPSARYPTASSLAVDLKQALFMPDQGELGPLINPLQVELPSPSPLPPAPPVPATLLPPDANRKRRKPVFRTLVAAVLVILVIALLIPFVGSRLITLFSPPAQIVGEASFLNSGQVNGTNNLGINDGLHIDLHNIADPSPDKSYYAWLLEDSDQSDSQAIFLGKLSITQGNVLLNYEDLQHHNLLEQYSRLLITEEDASMVPVGPSPDTSTWKYSATLPQTSDPKDRNHFSILDHLRHLLAADPDLQARNLPGGLDIWLYRIMGKVSAIAGTARGDWDNQSTTDMRQQLILILDYLDGNTLVRQDLPPNTLPPTNASFDSIGLLGQQNQLPQGYLAHIDTHLRSITQAPDVTQTMSQQATQISKRLNPVRQWLETVHADALRLLKMGPGQLLSPDAKLILDDMKTHADYAYVGGLNQEGVRQIYAEIQKLATFEVQTYIPR